MMWEKLGGKKHDASSQPRSKREIRHIDFLTFGSKTPVVIDFFPRQLNLRQQFENATIGKSGRSSRFVRPEKRFSMDENSIEGMFASFPANSGEQCDLSQHETNHAKLDTSADRFSSFPSGMKVLFRWSNET
jgi:hypothetical protein